MRVKWFLIFFTLLAKPAIGFDPATQDDSQALVRHFDKPKKPLSPFKDGKFEPMQGETITLMGGTGIYRLHENGLPEAFLHLAHPDKHLKIRNIGWPADTVYRQQRPMFFFTEKGDTKEGSVSDQRKRIEPGIFILQFGKMESLDGMDALPGFVAAYENLLGELSKSSPRIVLIGPDLFSEKGPAGDLAEARNEIVRAYSDAVAEIASKRRIPFWNSAAEKFIDETEGGFSKFAMNVLLEASANGRKEMGSFEVETVEETAEKIRLKNQLWNQYYRPTNWAFLFGDRQHVPSSRDYRDANRRWFVEEIEKLPPLIESADEAIWKEVKAKDLK